MAKRPVRVLTLLADAASLMLVGDHQPTPALVWSSAADHIHARSDTQPA